jgi:anti-sigma-K factor RsiG
METERARLEALLRRLGEEEHALSAQRAQLHRRLEVFPDPALAERERELSARRRELHARIDEVRAQLGLEPWRPDAADRSEPASTGFDVDFSTF